MKFCSSPDSTGDTDSKVRFFCQFKSIEASDPRRRHLRRSLCLVVTCILGLQLSVDAESPIASSEGLPTISWEDADAYLGRSAYVVGKIEQVGHARTIHFLNFHPSDRDKFTAVIFNDNVDRFKPSLESLYEGKLVRVQGTITRYRNTPQIVIASPEQIEILTTLPTQLDHPHAKTPPPTTHGQVTVATFNVLNLFDDVDDPYHADESTPAKPRKELEAIAQAIMRTNADVIALQEVETRGYLRRFVDVFLPDQGYEHVILVEGNDGRGIDVALLSRFPVGPIISNQERAFPGPDEQLMRFQRDLLQVEVRPPGMTPFEMWVVHLKSNSDGREFAEPIRLAEVRQIRKLYVERLERESTARILLCGDFNDTYDSKSLQQLVSDLPRPFVSFHHELPIAEQITYNREPYRSMIDFLLTSPQLAGQYVPGTFQILYGDTDTNGSDHNPVVLTFREAPPE